MKRVTGKKLWMEMLFIGSCILWTIPVHSNEPAKKTSQPDIDRGETLYQKFCQECHGAEGRGDGPRAPMLAPRPGNLVSAATSAKTDEELLAILAQGVPRTAMEGWSGRLTEDEQRDVLAYIRSIVDFQAAPSASNPSP